RAERADVAEHISRAIAKRLARDAHAGHVDFPHLACDAMPFQDGAAGAKRIGDETIGAGFHVTALDREDAVRVCQVPEFAAGAVFKAGEHELGAHRAVADVAAFERGFLKQLFHSPAFEIHRAKTIPCYFDDG